MCDFFRFRFVAPQAGPSLYRREGQPVTKPSKPKGRASEMPQETADDSWRAPHEAPESWQRWATGRTGLPLVDASMRELLQTGYCSNRVRQCAASFLSKDLRLDWRVGSAGSEPAVPRLRNRRVDVTDVTAAGSEPEVRRMRVLR